MKNRFIALLAMSSLILFGTTAWGQQTHHYRAVANAPAKVSPSPHKAKAHHVVRRTASSRSTGIVWKNWGGAPYASSDAEAMAKLGAALDAMVSGGIMPKEVADAFRADNFKLLRDNPEGVSIPAGKHAYLTPDFVLDGMMTGGAHPHLMRNVTVGKSVIMRGVVKAAEARVWSLNWGGTTYVLVDPLICHNWALYRVGNTVPPPVQADCYIVRSGVAGKNSDVSEHFSVHGIHAVSNVCWAYRIVGVTDWQSLDTCLDLSACLVQVQGMTLQFRGRIDVPKDCWEGCTVELRLPREVALSKDDLTYWCLIRLTKPDSCGVMVRHDDYHGQTATIFYKRPPETWAWRKLYWRFEADSRNCYLHYDP